MHFVAHNLELAAVDVLKMEKKQAMAEVETTLKGVSIIKAQICNVARQTFQHVLYVSYFSGLNQVRWLASRHRTMEALIKQLYVTVKHLETVDKEKAKDLLTNLKNAHF